MLAIQDTTEVKFQTSPGRRRGLGKIKKGNVYGVLAHSMVGVDAVTGACLGAITGEVWTRNGRVSKPHRDRRLAERESARWLRCAESAKSILTEAAMISVVADRESDIYAEWARLPGANFHLITRASSDRNLATGGKLFDAPRNFAVAGTAELQLPRRSPSEPGRIAKVTMRFGEVVLARPRHENDRTLPEAVSLRMIEVIEPDPPPGVEAIHWRLLTTHQVTCLAEAWQVVSWYKLRWIIEQVHRVMKRQGLNLEDSQVTGSDRLLKLTATAAKAATIAIQLVQERDGRDGLPAAAAFSEPQIETLAALGPTLEGKTARQQNPHPTNSLAWAAWIIARLGAWHCYGKPPGPITMRRGLETFYAINQGWHLRTAAGRLSEEVRIA
ncbi:MAG: IS4 family transposase [Acetobacteraceae bacterium]|nr:IS4 family transposase [Acetobacteraceae bacterium]